MERAELLGWSWDFRFKVGFWRGYLGRDVVLVGSIFICLTFLVSV